MASQSSSAALSFSSSAAADAAASSSQYTYANGSSYFPMPFHLQQPSAVSQYPTAYAVGPSIPIPPPSVVAPVYPAPAPVAGVYSLPQYQQVSIKLFMVFAVLNFLNRDQDCIFPLLLFRTNFELGIRISSSLLYIWNFFGI